MNEKPLRVQTLEVYPDFGNTSRSESMYERHYYQPRKVLLNSELKKAEDVHHSLPLSRLPKYNCHVIVRDRYFATSLLPYEVVPYGLPNYVEQLRLD